MTNPVNSIISVLMPSVGINTAPKRPFIERQAQVFKLGQKIQNGKTLTDEEREYLGLALQAISLGNDPFKAFDLETDTPGQNRSAGFIEANRRLLAVAWIAAAIEPDDKDNPGMRVGQAIEKAAETFGYTAGTMKRIWNESSRGAIVKLL
jgi:hypothetical protein